MFINPVSHILLSFSNGHRPLLDCLLLLSILDTVPGHSKKRSSMNQFRLLLNNHGFNDVFRSSTPEQSRILRHIRPPKRTPPLGSWGSRTGPLGNQGSVMLITPPCFEISSISSYYGWFNTCSNFHSTYLPNIFHSGPLRGVCRTEILTRLIPLHAGISFILCAGNTRSIVGVADLAEPRVAWVRPRF